MAFCTNCGASVDGAFCPQCGTPAAGTAAAAPAAPPAPSAYAPPAAAPAQRKTSPIVWVLVVVLGLFVLGGIAVVGTGLFVAHKVKQAGLDPDLMQKNPGLALSKLIVAANPDLEVVDVNEGKGVITVREKSTGKEVTMSFDDAKKGRFKIQSTDESGKSATMEIGGEAKMPSWVPKYPGAEVKGNFSANSGDGEGGMFNFNTKDAPAKIISFYTDELKGAGYKITATVSTTDSNMVSAEDESTRRTVMVTVGSGSDGSTVNVVYGVKK